MVVPKDINYAEFASDTYLPVNSRRKKIYSYELIQNQSDLYHSVYLDPITRTMHLSIRGTDPTHLPDIMADKDIMLGKEMDNIRVKQSLQKFRDLKALYSDYNHSVSGHSLAGMIAREIVAEHGVEGHSFNPGIRPYLSQLPEAYYTGDAMKAVPNRQIMERVRCRVESDSMSSRCANVRNNLHSYYVKSGPVVDPISEASRIRDTDKDGYIFYRNAKKVTTVPFNSAKASHPHGLENYL